MPRTKRFHALKRPKLRQDWSKWNLYNLSRVTTPPATNKTLFQQKWSAKSMLRCYHNPDVRERTWTRLFDRRLPAVVPMDHRYLASSDGSEMATGRGMGVEQASDVEIAQGGRNRGIGAPRRNEKTPYMHMAFHPLERRLDTAVFRALFASSVRQARQFVVRGFVKVNGKEMVYPGYQLNPGDMFTVDPEMVMFATGQPKHRADSHKSTREVREAREARKMGIMSKAGKKENGDKADIKTGEELEQVNSEQLEPTGDPADPETLKQAQEKLAKKNLKGLLQEARRILDESKQKLSGSRLIELRSFTRSVRKTLSQLKGIDESEVDETVDGLETTLSSILSKVAPDTLTSRKPSTEAAAATPAIATAASGSQHVSESLANATSSSITSTSDAARARKDAELLHAALEQVRKNPIDVSKPYATPWKPRDYMSAFAFIPRYLEVNQNICSAIYVRHPVARPGLAEVPTPFSGETLTLGFNWYLRRR